MPLLKLSASAAYHNFRHNALARYPRPDVDQERLEPLASPSFEPSFRLEPGEPIFTIGSCFARNVERHVEAVGFDVPARRWLAYKETDPGVPAEFLNKYVPTAIHDEIRWALDPDASFPWEALLEVGSDQWFDPFWTAAVDPAPREVVVRRRETAMEIMREIARCRVVVVTLGLIEAWFDRETGLYLNCPPRPWSYLSRHLDRFEVHIQDYDEALRALEGVHELLRRFGHPEFRILLTVSPVPLVCTFTDRDVLVANMYSKSVLRAAAEAFCYRHDNVDYFPSYESVVLSSRGLAWEHDNRHVTASIVGVNVARMIRAYLPDSREAEFHYHDQLGRVLLDHGSPEAAERALRAALELDPDAGETHLHLGIALYRQGRPDDAVKAFRRASKLGARTASPQFWLGVALRQAGRLREAEKALRSVIRQNGSWAPAFYHLAVVLRDRGREAEARSSARTALDLKPDFEDARRFLDGAASAR